MDTFFSSDTRPLESVTLAAKVIVPDEDRIPVVKLDYVLEKPPPEIEYEDIVDP